MKYPRYPAYKDSGVEWIGDIPILWKLTKFRRIANTVKGKLDSAPLYERITENCIPYLSMEYLRSEIDPIQWVHKENSSVIANKGDILLLWDGSNAGEFLRAKFGAVSSTIALVKPKKVNEGYFFYLCKFIEIQIQELTVGMGIPHVDADVLKDFITLLPSIDEQDKLYNFLESRISRINFLITNLQKMIELLKEKRQAIITHAVTKGLDPNVPMKDSGVEWIGKIPEYWTSKKIKHTSYVKGRVGWKGLTSEEYMSEGYAYLVTGQDFRYQEIDWSSCYCVDKSRYDDDPYIQLRNGDLLITKDGTIGKLAIVENLEKPACLNSGIFLVRPINSYTSHFLFWVLRSKTFSSFYDLRSMGSTIQHLYQNVFDNFSFPIPPIEEQNGIVHYLNSQTIKIDSLISNLYEMIGLLKDHRTSLISAAMTGKIDVRNLKINEISESNKYHG